MFNVSVVQMFENWCTVLDSSLKENAVHDVYCFCCTDV